jgi:uncharacterized membrane protein
VGGSCTKTGGLHQEAARRPHQRRWSAVLAILLAAVRLVAIALVVALLAAIAILLFLLAITVFAGLVALLVLILCHSGFLSSSICLHIRQWIDASAHRLFRILCRLNLCYDDFGSLEVPSV